MKHKIFAILIIIIGLSNFSLVEAQTKAWGYAQYGALGIGRQGTFTTPVDMPPTNAVAIDGGSRHTLFLLSDRTVTAAGEGLYGKLGDGTGNTRLSPVAVTGLSNVIAISAGGDHSLALKADGTVWAWGRNTSGQLGDNTLTNRTAPVQVPGLSDVIGISAGAGHSLAVKSDGTVWAWGANLSGQLGISVSTTTGCYCKKVPVQMPSVTDAVAVSAGGTSMMLKTDGTVWAWGKTSSGGLGNGTAPLNACNCTAIPKQTSIWGVTQISAGDSYNAALRWDGTVWTWGDNTYGQIGKGTAGGKQLSPYLAVSSHDVVEIQSGGWHTLIRTDKGEVWAWGWNKDGEMGNGTMNPGGCYCSLIRAQSSVGAGNTVIGAGATHSFAGRSANSTLIGNTDRAMLDRVSIGKTKLEAAIRANVAQMASGWNAKSGAEFAKPFAEDADYVVINGMYIKGRAAIAQGHQQIFDTFYKNTNLTLIVERIRFLRADVAVVHVVATLKLTENETARTTNARITMVMTKTGDKWEIAAFQNSEIQATGGK